MICKHCGAEIDTRVQGTDGLVVCPECGAMYRRKQSSAVDNGSSYDVQIIRKDDLHVVQSSATDKPIRRSKTILLVIFPVIAICIILAIILYNKPGATILRRNNTISNFSASWCYFVVGEPEEVTFVAEARKAPILFRGTDRIGVMHDDGKDGDAISGDGIYSYEIRASSEIEKTEQYYAGFKEPSTEPIILSYYDQPTEVEIEQFEDARAHIASINSEIENSYGYINGSDKETALKTVGEYAEQLLSAGVISEYHKNEENIFIRFTSGLTTIYIPEIEGLLSNDEDLRLSFVTFEPFKDDFKEVQIDDIAHLITTELNNCSLYNRLDDDGVTLEAVKESFTSNRVALWFGHGTWDSSLHSVIITGESNVDAFFLYLPDYLTGRITTTLGRTAFCSGFIDKYCGNMNNSMVYLNCCESGKDSTLSDTFLKKGASLVVCNTDTMKAEYGHYIQYRMLDNMRIVNTEKGRYYTAAEALQLAKQEFGYSDIDYNGIGAETVIRGDYNYRLSNKEYDSSNNAITTPPDKQKDVDNDLSKYFASDDANNLSREERYKVNSLLSIFSEQGAFEYYGFYWNDDNPERNWYDTRDQLVLFAYLYTTIHHPEKIERVSNFCTISLDIVKDVLQRYLNFSINDWDPEEFTQHTSLPIHLSYDNCFYFYGPDGDAHNKFTIITRMVDRDTNHPEASFDIYELSSDVYTENNGHIPDKYYYYSPAEAQASPELTKLKSGYAILNDYVDNGTQTFQVGVYRIADESESILESPYQPVNPGDFSIVGVWENVGEGYAHTRSGDKVIFDGEHCNFYSAYDTYSIQKINDETYRLSLYIFVYNSPRYFDIRIIDNDNIELISEDGVVISLRRVQDGGMTTSIETSYNDIAPTAEVPSAPGVSGNSSIASQYEWVSFTVPETTSDGYQIEKIFRFVDTWIDSDDISTIDKICNEIGVDKNKRPHIDTDHDIFNADATEPVPHCKYLFGTYKCRNVTEGFPITEANAKTVDFYHIGLISDDESISDSKIEWNSVLKKFASESVNSFHGWHHYHDIFYNDWYGESSLRITLKSNNSGIVPFVIAVYSPINPNFPQGDNWYQSLRVAIYGGYFLDERSVTLLDEFRPKD